MTHPPPDPEGRQRQDEAERQQLQIQGLAAENVKLRRIVADLKVALRICEENAREDLCSRLDAALATKDPQEAVERCWALVRELRGEEA